MAVLNWNCNSFYSHLGELQNIVNQTSPYFICLQETRLKPYQKASLTGYSPYRKDREDDIIASRGVAIYSKNIHHTEEIYLQTNLEAIAVSCIAPNKFTLCCIYLPPNETINKQEIVDLINQLPQSFILTGDFNCHNPLWGSTHTDRRGKQIEDTIDDDIILLNDGAATHFCARTGKFSNIDLTLCDATLAPNLTWEVIPYLHGSVHFPIKISFSDQKYS